MRQPAETVGELIASAPRELLEAILSSVADAVYVVDPDGRVQFLNPAALSVLGYDHPEELVGKVSHPTIHYKRPDGSPYPDEECPMLRPRLTGETVVIDEDWFVRRDGTMVPVAYSSAPFPMDGRRGAVVAFRDISERMAREELRRVEASRARIVAAADAERRRLGRDLHDGAQQRLVHLLMTLQRARAGGDDAAAAIEEAAGEARAAIAELRELAAGIHPAILTNRGLRAAVDALTVRAPVPVDIDIDAKRWPAVVESTVYFVIAEALTNVAKHADGATEAWVRAVEREGVLCVEVRDDGPGGADPAGGSGLAGLEDRVAAAGGELVLRSDERGTRLRATVPL